MSQKNWFLLLAAGLAVSACAPSEEEEELECDETGKCDSVPASPCDGIMKDKSGTNFKRVAGRRNDPLAKAVFREGTTCPKTFKDIMAKLRKNDKENCAGELDGIETRLISETAQASGKATSYRSVTTRTCGNRDTDGIIFSLFGIEGSTTTLPKAVEIIAFDETAGIYNFYETDGTTLNFFGNSKDLLKGPGANDVRRCANCHTGGGLIMKELDAPWLHWEGHMDTPGAQKIVDANKDLGTKADGIEFEGVVKGGNTKWNATRLAHLKAAGKLQDVLKPLFCTVEVNLDNGADFESPVKGGRGGDELSAIPFDELFDPQLKTFGSISVTFADYDALIKANGQNVKGVTGAIDTVFDHVFIERSHADNNYVEQVRDAKIIDDAFIKDVLMVDFTRPVFSDDRCGLLSFAPDLTATNMTAKKVRDGFIANLEAETPVAGSPAAQLLAHLKASNDTAAHDATVDAFVAACTALGSKPFLQNSLAITSLNREKARQMPVFEFESTMPTDNQSVDANARLHPKTCQVVTQFVAP